MDKILKKSRMSGVARREQILRCARSAFASRGFYGTTTREVARSAGVSEALLFKHFSSKLDLYHAMVEGWFVPPVEHNSDGGFPFPAGLCASAKVVFMTYYMAHWVLGARSRGDVEEILKQRLMVQSLLGDGQFARVVYEYLSRDIRDEFFDLWDAAIASGECRGGAFRKNLALMLVVNLQWACGLYLRHDSLLADESKASFDEVLDCYMRFVLRGYGFYDEVIERDLAVVKTKFAQLKFSQHK